MKSWLTGKVAAFRMATHAVGQGQPRCHAAVPINRFRRAGPVETVEPTIGRLAKIAGVRFDKGMKDRLWTGRPRKS
ncbi:MAG: hypothetical protein KF777_12970 [Planctomycetaceae bacterium]|nr:hypothetical protein [Planctomycetaceae bacterium]